MYFIYGIYNTINGKLYVGYTKNMKDRWKDHIKKTKSLSENNKKYAIHKAMTKYGSQNFIHKEIDTAIDIIEAKAKEIWWIAKLKLAGYILYNETNGGEGAIRPGKKVWTDEQRKEYSIMFSGPNHPCYGRIKSPEEIEKIKAGVAWRRKLTDQQHFDIKSLYNTGNYSQKELAELFNVVPTTINTVIHNKKRGQLISKPHIDIEITNEVKNLYNTGNYTQRELAKQFSISPMQISRIVNGKGKRYGNKEHDEILTKPRINIDDAKYIKQSYADGTRTKIELAKQFNLSERYIYDIVNGKRWKNS